MPQPKSENGAEGLIKKIFFTAAALALAISVTLGLISIEFISIFGTSSGIQISLLFFSIVFLVFFYAFPLLIPRYFLLGSAKPNYVGMVERVKSDTSLSAYVLYLTQTLRFPFYSFFIGSLMVLTATLPLIILSIMVFGTLIESIVKIIIIIIILWTVTIGTHIHISNLRALMGYSGEMPSIRHLTEEKAYSEGLDEAKLYMVIARDDLEKNNPDWTVSFYNSLLTLDKTLRKRKKIQITNLKNIIQTVSKIRKIDSYSRHEIVLRCFIERLIYGIESKKIDEIVSTLYDFQEEPELRYLEEFKRPTRTNLKNAAVTITTTVASVVIFLFTIFPRASEQLQDTVIRHGADISAVLLILASFAVMAAILTFVSPPDEKTRGILKRKSSENITTA
jgi:hypothetical protein